MEYTSASLLGGREKEEGEKATDIPYSADWMKAHLKGKEID